jgi:hypothetical protein
MGDYYVIPWYRGAPYALGILFGAVYVQEKELVAKGKQWMKRSWVKLLCYAIGLS